MPGANVKRMRERLESDPDIFYVAVLDLPTFTSAMLQLGYSNTVTNRIKLQEAIMPHLSQFLIDANGAIAAAIREVYHA